MNKQSNRPELKVIPRSLTWGLFLMLVLFLTPLFVEQTLVLGQEQETPVPEPIDQNEKPRQAPEQFADPDKAVPLPSNSASNKEIIRKYIEYDMQDASSEEREIWFEYLKNEQPELARNLLNLRKTFGSSFPPSSILGTDISVGPAAPAEEGDLLGPVESEPTETKPPGSLNSINLESEELAELKALWTTVRSMAMFNISQSHLPGYKRLDFVSTIERPGFLNDEVTATTDLPEGTYRIDLTQGEMEETGGELDVALKGMGWFPVVDPDTRASCYTRNGQFSRDLNGQLVVHVGDREYPLEPEINVPIDATEISISDTGEVTSNVDSSETELGQLQIVRFPNASSLHYLGQGIYVASRRSGRPVLANPLPGMVQQGFLERSNVSEETEFSKLDRYYEQWKTGLKLMSEYPLMPTK